MRAVGAANKETRCCGDAVVKIGRRRFLAISAASLLCGSATAAQVVHWHGKALGPEARISIRGDRETAEQALQAALDTLRRMERLFSLYDPGSTVSLLNRDGQVSAAPEFARLVRIAGKMHAISLGLFDPTVQPTFEAFLTNGGAPPRELLEQILNTIGWDYLNVEPGQISFAKPGMALTFNGIAQGYATDRVSEVLAAHGFGNTLVNIGEYRAGDEEAQISIEGMDGKAFHTTGLRQGAIATSSPGGFRFRDGSGHIISPSGNGSAGIWETVSVMAETAAVADALSTALCLTSDTELAREIKSAGHAKNVILRDIEGKVHIV